MSIGKPRSIPKSQDPLGEALYLLRLNGSLYCQSELTVPWSIDMPEMNGNMMFHIVMSGQCELSVPGHNPVLLKAGSLALLPKGKGHRICSSREVEATPLFDIPVHSISERFEFLRFGGESGESTSLLCGVISFDHMAGAKLIEQLPAVIHFDHKDSNLSHWLSSTIEFISHEASALRAGGETIMSHLADIIVIQAIRYWMEQAPEAETGWLGALKDPKLGKALTAIHSQPSEAWTLESLAATAGMSRSGFSARFKDVVGTSVKQYLTQWRMNMARARLLTDKIPLGVLAEELGYQSEAAFSRAYKRTMGESPVRHLV